MIRVVPLELSHLDALNAAQYAEKFVPGDRAFTMLQDDKPIAVGGIHLLGEGEGVGWTVISEEAKKSPLVMRRIHIASRELFKICVETMHLTHVETFAKKSDARACHWPKAFGFKVEDTYTRFVWSPDV